MQKLTALDRDGGSLQRQHLPVGLGDVHTEHHPNTSVLPPDVCFALPELNVGVPELQDASTVNTARAEQGELGNAGTPHSTG